MKLLFDENLSRRLPAVLSDVFPGSTHVVTAGLGRAWDEEIWDYASTYGFVIVTQDGDFADLAASRTDRVKLVWVRIGNPTTHDVDQRIRRSARQIHEFGAVDDAWLLELR